MSRHTKLFIIISMASCFAVMVYSLSRQADTVYFLPYWLSVHNTGFSSGLITNSLPSLLHVYIFILLSAVIAVPSISKLLPVCVFWFVFDTLLELAQLDLIATTIASQTHGWFTEIPILENVNNYLLFGTFDPLDIVFCLIGTLLAYLTFTWLYGEEKNATYSQL